MTRVCFNIDLFYSTFETRLLTSHRNKGRNRVPNVIQEDTKYVVAFQMSYKGYKVGTKYDIKELKLQNKEIENTEKVMNKLDIQYQNSQESIQELKSQFRFLQIGIYQKK